MSYMNLMVPLLFIVRARRFWIKAFVVEGMKTLLSSGWRSHPNDRRVCMALAAVCAWFVQCKTKLGIDQFYEHQLFGDPLYLIRDIFRRKNVGRTLTPLAGDLFSVAQSLPTHPAVVRQVRNLLVAEFLFQMLENGVFVVFCCGYTSGVQRSGRVGRRELSTLFDEPLPEIGAKIQTALGEGAEKLTTWKKKVWAG